MPGWNDPHDPGNGPEYHTGERCSVPDCDAPAGTAWSPYWCFVHNVERIERADRLWEEAKAVYSRFLSRLDEDLKRPLVKSASLDSKGKS